MQRYKNLDGDSGGVAYELGGHSLKLRFRGGDIYLQDEKTPGRGALARTQALPLVGRGLSTYISRYVRDKYAAKL
jgi:hypothetical protein